MNFYDYSFANYNLYTVMAKLVLIIINHKVMIKQAAECYSSQLARLYKTKLQFLVTKFKGDQSATQTVGQATSNFLVTTPAIRFGSLLLSTSIGEQNDESQTDS